MGGDVAIRLLGPVRLVTPAGEEGLRGHRARLLAWLALEPGRVWAADDLVDRLWPAGPPPTARTALQGHVAKLRAALGGAAVIETVGRAYVLRAGPGAVDVARFDTLVRRARRALDEPVDGPADGPVGGPAGGPADAVDRLSEALALWSGPALADLRDDALLAVEGAALDARRAGAEDDLARALLDAGEVDEAVSLLERLVVETPMQERRWGQLMVALHRAGRQADALRAYQRAAAALAEEAGLEPGRELRRLERAVLLQDPGLDGARRGLAPAWRLPAPLTTVVGRDAERFEVEERLRSARLVTLVGPGGVGKTTLALDVAAGVAPALADGAVVVDLAGAGPGDVDRVVAAAIGADASGDAGRAAAGAVAAADVLVVLDNCEHVLAEAAGAVLALLRAGPGVRVLATSQQPLRVVGEAVVALAPLPVPGEDAEQASAEAAPACRLLAERLRAGGRAPAGDGDWRRVAAVARATGGLPLALEVAAAWGRTAGLAAVVDRLHGDDLLRAEPPAGAGRRGLGAALDAAAGSLDGPARRAYAAASLFPGWFGIDLLAAAAGLPPAQGPAVAAALVDASLAVAAPARDDDGPAAVARAAARAARAAAPGGEVRLRLLPPVRRHAATALGSCPEAGAAARRLLDRCLAVAAELDALARGPRLPEAANRLVEDLPTWRAVLRRALDGGQVVEAAHLFTRLGFCWAGSPAANELARWADELLRVTGALPAAERIRVEVLAMQAADTFETIAAHLPRARELVVAADDAGDAHAAALARLVVALGLGWRGEDLAGAAALAAEARAALLAAGDGFWAAEAACCQGLVAFRRLDLAGGTAHLEHALAEHRVTGSPVGIARVLFFLGAAHHMAGDPGGARRAYTEVRRLLAGGRVTTWLRATTALGHACLADGDAEAAAEAFREAHARATEAGDRRIAVQALGGVAAAVRRSDGARRAAPLFLAAVREALDAEEAYEAALAATSLADVLAGQGRPVDAALLLGAAEAVPPPPGVRLAPALPADAVEALAGRLAAALGERPSAKLRAEGALLGLAATVAAVTEPGRPAEPGPEPGAGRSAEPEPEPESRSGAGGGTGAPRARAGASSPGAPAP